MSAPTLARPTLRCRGCELMQFATASGNCRRCRQPYLATSAPALPAKSRGPKSGNPPRSRRVGRPEINFGHAVFGLRIVRGWSALELSQRLDCPRTWLTKIERGYCDPNLSSIYRLARAFEVRPWFLVGLATGLFDDLQLEGAQ